MLGGRGLRATTLCRIGGFVSDFSKYLRPGESVTLSARVSPKAIGVGIAMPLLFVIVFWAVMSFLMGMASSSPFQQAFAPIAALIYKMLMVASALFGLAILGLAAIQASFISYGLTDSRVLRRSFLRVRGADLAHVQDVEVVQTLLGKLLGYGNVVVRTASTDGTLVLASVDRPHDWFRLIHESVRNRQASI